MKILYIITKSNFGGAQRYVHDLAIAAKKAGHDVVVAFGGEGPLGEKLRAAEVRTISIPELERDVRFTKDIRAFGKLFSLIRSERPDVLHLNSSKVGGLGGLAGRLANALEHSSRLLQKTPQPTRIIFTGHGWAFNEDRNDLERFLIGLAHWLTITLSHRTITVSRKTREQIAKIPFTWHKLTIVYNGVGPIKTLAKKRALEGIFPNGAPPLPSAKPIVIGTLAELHRNKGLSYAIEGMALLAKQSSVPFIFVVLGEGEERHALESLIRMRGLEKHVHLVGYRESGTELLSAFDIFLLPSITEAFPYAILEAGKLGLPVIASAVGGIPEVIDDMDSGILIQTRNPMEIARAVGYLLEDPDRRKGLGTKIEARIADRFNIRTMTGETFAVYEGDRKEGEAI